MKKNIYIIILALLLGDCCSYSQISKGPLPYDIYKHFQLTINISCIPDYSVCILRDSYVDSVVHWDSSYFRPLIPILIKTQDTILPIVSTIDYLYSLYCTQIEIIEKKTFVDIIKNAVINRKCIDVKLPSVMPIGEPFYQEICYDDLIFNMIESESDQVFFKYLFRKQFGYYCYDDGPYKLGAVAEKLFYMGSPLFEKVEHEETDRILLWNLEQFYPNSKFYRVSKSFKEYLNKFGGRYYVDGNIVYRRISNKLRWWL